MKKKKPTTSEPHLHPLAWAFLRAEREALLRCTVESIVDATAARTAWLVKGALLLEGETAGSVPSRALPPS